MLIFWSLQERIHHSQIFPRYRFKRKGKMYQLIFVERTKGSLAFRNRRIDCINNLKSEMQKNICFDAFVQYCSLVSFFSEGTESCWAWNRCFKCYCTASINQNVFTHVSLRKSLWRIFEVARTENDFAINNWAWALNFMLCRFACFRCSFFFCCCLAYLERKNSKQQDELVLQFKDVEHKFNKIHGRNKNSPQTCSSKRCITSVSNLRNWTIYWHRLLFE